VYNDASIDRVNNDNVEVSGARLATYVGGGEGQGLCSGRQGADWIGGIACRRYCSWSADIKTSACFMTCVIIIAIFNIS